MQSLVTFQRLLKGDLYVPTDDEYARAKRGVKGNTPVDDRHPAIVVQAEGVEDVARTIEFARTNRIDLSVRSGGHDFLGVSTTDSGILLDLCKMDEVDLDPSTAVVRVGGGGRAGPLMAAGRPHGLTPILGISPNVGIGGLTLGGGMGFLSGAYGATVDHVLAIEVVTANGQWIKADPHNHPELFWALRGGGGNFGVATAFTLQMQPVAKVLAGNLNFRADPRKLLQFIRGFLVESGDALDIELRFTMGSEPTANIRVCWSGEPEAGYQVLQPLRSFAPAIRDTVKLQDFGSFLDERSDIDNMLCRGGEFDGLTDQAIEAFADVVEKGGPADCFVSVLHYMHGALCRVPKDDTPFIRPAGHILYNIAAPWQGPEPQLDKVNWVIATWDALKAANSERTYLNYLCDESEDAVRRSFGPHYSRLRDIKRKYDPENFFRNNRNIRI